MHKSRIAQANSCDIQLATQLIATYTTTQTQHKQSGYPAHAFHPRNQAVLAKVDDYDQPLPKLKPQTDIVRSDSYKQLSTLAEYHNSSGLHRKLLPAYT
ncbi:hypothetical protein F511_39357 [Dorcoceras hygrometricum]|uniref:Uncharacterized protein n=1 Tax=Dorcoceras hygrometricum TaxID=472368 RepID=A0A2Z7BSM5_9LAMI|nr:hypothetical protein F511_39357 [Dorcoceras hygrometricum]